MSDFTQAALIGGSITAVVIATQYGRRALELKGIIRLVAMVGGFAWCYGSGAPTGHSELWLYAAGLGLGLVFAAIATAFTQVERDQVTGRVMTLCGAGFVATWLVALTARLVFVWLADYNAGFRNQLGEFMYHHQIHQEAIAPFFLVWALTMVVGRVTATFVRVSHLPSASRSMAVAAAS